MFAGFMEASFGFWVAGHPTPCFCKTRKKLSNTIKENGWE